MISAPPTFVMPTPLNQASLPPPTPPSYLKHQVYDDPHVFEKVDFHAIRVARNTYTTFKDLLWDLVFHYKLNDLEKARVIFRWMTSCDMNALNFKVSPKGSPEEVLLSLKNLKGSYANALELMCSYSGLFCLTISGYAKGVDYRPGDLFKEQAFNHSWNVIYIQDSWQLIDAHWATRYLTARKNTQDSIVYQYDDFYFIMEPQQAVYSHFPEDSAWQLLKEPLTLNQFENLPLTKSQFFKCGMDFQKQHHGVVHSKDGNLKMTLGFLKPDSFTYKLVTDKNADVFEGVSLKYFVIQETVNNRINFYFRFPAAGNYYLTVFVQELNEHNVPVNQENIFRAACEYKIIADKAASNSLPYPMSCHDLNWGPQWSLISHYNLVPVQEDGVISIKSPNAKPFVRTEIKFDKMRDEVGLLCKLRKNGVDDEDILDQYIEIIEKSEQTTFILNLPEPGEYGLEVYANEPSEGDTYTHVCQYLLDFEPPPGYKPQSSVFGPNKAGSSMIPLEPSNIREMYNYEKDASPMGVLPNPYLVSQYAPEDATMIPGQSKNKPKPFAYNKTNKSDESEVEIPDFLPPPPPSGNVVPQFTSKEGSSTLPLSDGDKVYKTNGNYTHPPSSEDVSNRFLGSSRPVAGEINSYNPQNQSMSAGDNLTPESYRDNLRKTDSKFGQPTSSEDLVNQRNISSVPATGIGSQYSPQNQSLAAGNKMYPGTQKENYKFGQPTSSDDLVNQRNISSVPAPGIGNQYSPQNQSLAAGNKMYPGTQKENYKFGQPTSSDDLVNQRNSSSIPISGGPNKYTPQNQSMFGGVVTLDEPYKEDISNFPPPPPPPSDAVINELNAVLRPTSGDSNKFRPSNQSISHGAYSLQGAKPFTKSQVGGSNEFIAGGIVYPGVGISKSEKSDEELMEQTVRLQPYLANIDKGLSPQLSRKVHDYSGKGASGSVTGSARSDLSFPGSPKKYSSIDNDEWIRLSSVNIVSSAFGKNNDLTSKQPYLYNLETGGSPLLSRQSGPKLLNQGRSFDSSNVIEPSTISKDSAAIDSTKPTVFRGYGRPNFASVQNEPTTTSIITGQYQIPPQDSGVLPSSDNVAATIIQKEGQFKDENSRKISSEKVPSLYGVSNAGGRISSYTDQSKVTPGNVHLQGAYGADNFGELDKSSPNYLSGRRSYDTRNPNDPQSKQTNNVTQGRSSPYKEESYKSSYPGYKVGAYGDRSGSLGDPRKDTTKISNIAVTLSPAGFKKPQQVDTPSDQYNNQYEDSSKIMPSPIQKYRPDDSTANWTSGPVQKEPPKNFQPTPISVEEEIYKPEVQALPHAVPVTASLSPEESSKIFQRIDDHAMQVSAQHQDSFNQLIWQLIYARNITDELEKVRVIFLWLCTKDLHKMNFDDIKKDSPEEILMGLKSGKSTYAQIFLTLCRYAGLHCKLIVGYAKGADYVPGMQFQGRHGEHSWNAVLIGGVWRLVDCHWAARRLIGKERKPENVRYELDMFYFLANPSQLIYTHFPHEQDWQLLHHPINIEEFESLAPVKSMFFKYNLDLVTHKNAIINATSPEFELQIAFPKGVEERLLFTFTLTFNDGSDDYKGLSLLRYGRQEINYIENHSSFWIRAPMSGSYKLLLYAKLISVDQSISDSNSQNMFGAICEYKVEFNFPDRHAMSPFPPCQTSTYGPSEVYKRYAIESCTTQSSIFTENGTAEIKFLIHKPDTRVMAKLINSSGKNTDQITEQCVLQRLVGTEEAVVNVFLPESGEYGLEIYANDSKKDGNSFYTVWQYFIVTNSPSIVNGLPSLPMGYMGPYEPKFSNFGLSIYSHKDPFIVAKTGELCIQLKTTREKPVRIMTQLIHCSHNVSEMCSNQVLQQARDSIVYFLIRFPHQGFFKLQIFALPYSEMSESLPGVFNYLIEGNHNSNQRVLEFPQQFAQWKEGCYLYEPTDGVLGVNNRPDNLTFRLDVPRANGIAIVVNNEWTKLEKDSSDTWTGNVVMRSFWGKREIDQLTVCASYGMALDDSFTTILKYTIQ